MTTHAVLDRLGLPPPLDLKLLDVDRAVGWVVGDTVGYRGFSDETEAAHAAWIAHRTLARRLARSHGTRPVPIDVEPLALQWVDDKETIVASGEPFAVLVRPGVDSRSGVDSFGFELAIPSPTTELEARALAYLMYRTLRKSGVRWAMWRPEVVRTAAPAPKLRAAPASEVARHGDAHMGDGAERPRWRGWALPDLRSWRDAISAMSLRARRAQ